MGIWALFAGIGVCAVSAQSRPIKAEVSYVWGQATYTLNGGAPQRVGLTTVLPPGAVVRTGPGASLDIHLGYNVLLLRLPQNTALSLDNLTVNEQPEGKFIDVQLTLSQGSIVGQVTELAASAKFEVKLANGVASVRDGRYRLHAEGYLVQLQGRTLFAYVPPGGQASLQTLQAPPAQYFTPREGVRRAPQPLIKEVTDQLKPRLRAP